MLITLEKVDIQGFRSFAVPQTFVFPPGPGLYFLTGANEAEPRLEGNGAGKSTVWDAILWCLTGKTTTGLRGPDVECWNDECVCRVAVHFRVGDEARNVAYEVVRTHSPNSLVCRVGTETTKTVTQEELDEFTGVGYEALLRLLIVGQFGEHFFDLRPAEKLRVFADVLGLDYWRDRSTAAAKQAKEAQAEVRRLESLRDTAAGTLQAVRDQLEDLRRLEAQYQAATAKQTREIGERLVGARDIWRQARTSYRARKAELLAEEAKYAGTDAQAAQARKAVREATEAARSADKLAATTQANYETARAACDRTAATDTCEACGQPLTPAALRQRGERLATLERKAASLAQAAREAAANAEATNALYEERTAAAQLIEVGRARTEQRLAELRGVRQTASTALTRATATLEELRRLRRALKGPSPYAAKLATTTAQEAGLANDYRDLDGHWRRATTAQAEYEYWTKEFKRLRLWLIEEGLLEFEIEVNAALPQLGLDGWEVKLAVEREGKANPRREFVVYVRPPGRRRRLVRWEVWSGGERQRLRVAGAAGLMGLITGRRGTRFSAEAWDEPTAHLSASGISDLLTYLEGRAAREDRQIWLVDHRSINYGGFSGVARVVKDADGTSRVEEWRAGQPGTTFDKMLPWRLRQHKAGRRRLPKSGIDRRTKAARDAGLRVESKL